MRHRRSWFAQPEAGNKITLMVGVLTAAAILLAGAVPLVMWWVQRRAPAAAATAPASGPATAIPSGLLHFERHQLDPPWAVAAVQWQEKNPFTGRVSISCTPALPDAGATPHSDRRSRFASGNLRGVGRLFVETLIVYADEDTAAKVFNEQRAAVERCVPFTKDSMRWQTWQEPAGLGEESIRVYQTAVDVTGGPDHTEFRGLVVRRGTALLFYGDMRIWEQTPQWAASGPADFSDLNGYARSVLAGMCRFDPQRPC